jgi:hypothetical protein
MDQIAVTQVESSVVRDAQTLKRPADAPDSGQRRSARPLRLTFNHTREKFPQPFHVGRFTGGFLEIEGLNISRDRFFELLLRGTRVGLCERNQEVSMDVRIDGKGGGVHDVQSSVGATSGFPESPFVYLRPAAEVVGHLGQDAEVGVADKSLDLFIFQTRGESSQEVQGDFPRVSAQLPDTGESLQESFPGKLPRFEQRDALAAVVFKCSKISKSLWAEENSG